MESLLGFVEPPANDVVFDQLHNYKFVQWINWDEWDFVRASLFSSSPQSIASALQRVTAWRSGGFLPNDLSGEAVDSEEILAMLYCMAIMRLVNDVIEKTREKTEVSIAEAAGAIGIPRMLIDVRHGEQILEDPHRDLPSLNLVRLARLLIG